MALKDIGVLIRGRSPLLMNRYPGELPSEPKPPRGKKTQEHIDANRKKKWLRAAYWARDTFHVPPENIEAMMVQGARKNRRGEDFKSAVMVVEDFVPLIFYTSPEDTKGKQLTGKLENYYVPDHIDIRGVVIQKARVDACRPIFREWGLAFTVRYDSEDIEEAHIRSALEKAKLGDFRPRFGQFRIVEFHNGRGSNAG